MASPSAVYAGRTLLYLTDNAGEIGFDRVCAEQIAKRYPHVQITFLVRGGYTLNDATREDAAAVGIPFPVIDSGNSYPGTLPDALGAQAKQALETADVILAKGMGNTESLYGCGYNVYYAFLVKCQMFADRFQKPLGRIQILLFFRHFVISDQALIKGHHLIGLGDRILIGHQAALQCQLNKITVAVEIMYFAKSRYFSHPVIL